MYGVWHMSFPSVALIFRVQLKMAENLAEELASHVKDSIEEREARLRRDYEEKLRKYVYHSIALNKLVIVGTSDKRHS